MATILPNIQVTDARNRDPSPFERQDTGKLVTRSEGSSSVSGKQGKQLLLSTAAKLRSPSSTSTSGNANIENVAATQPNGIGNGNGNAGGTYTDGRESSAAIDPLSQQIMKRTNTGLSVQKLRTQVDSTAIQSPTREGSEGLNVKGVMDTAREVSGGAIGIGSGNGSGNGKGDKSSSRKGVSFFGRFIGGNKKKGAAALDGTTLDDGSDAGDSGMRAEGMEKVDNLGFNPRYPQPPPYVKVRTKFKKEKEFDRLFLAQELRCAADKNAPPVTGANPAPQSGSAATQNPIWATEFSKDGKYLAAGGQDRIVRVWAVLSTPEERSAAEKEESEASVGEEEGMRLSAPVFQQKPVREYHGHTATILDLSWSKNNFLLSSSMDKTVRLWHISRGENLCTFKHTDFVPSIQFHPKDDRFFLAGSLDTKLRLWSIPDKSVAFWAQTSDMITAVSFTPDGRTCIAGTLSGLCLFYDTDGLKYQTQMHVKSTRGQNAKGSKITGIQATYWPPGSDSGDVKLLISSNDSRIRLYNLRDKSLEMKFRGHENNCSQIRATFAGDTEHIICGSEDRKVYIWSTTAPEGEKRHNRPLEMFEAHGSITTCAVVAPLKTRQVLGASEDPIYDLCNPPPVTLVSKAESLAGSSRAPTEAGGGSALPTPTVDSPFLGSSKKTAETTPAYLARSAHKDGPILVTADYTGAIKVFRQDCAYAKRTRLIMHSKDENWDASSVFSKRTGSRFGGGVGRPSSVISGRRMGAAQSVKSVGGIIGRARRDSTSTQPPEDRIRSWRQDIVAPSSSSLSASASASNLSAIHHQHGLALGGFDAGIPSPRRSMARSKSPRKSRLSISSLSVGMRPSFSSESQSQSLALGPVRAATLGPGVVAATPKTSFSAERTLVPGEDVVEEGGPVKPGDGDEPWGPVLLSKRSETFHPGDAQRRRRETMSSDDSSISFRSARDGPGGEDDEDEEEEGVQRGEDEVQCQHCGGTDFKVRVVMEREKERRMVVCGRCGEGGVD